MGAVSVVLIISLKLFSNISSAGLPENKLKIIFPRFWSTGAADKCRQKVAGYSKVFICYSLFSYSVATP